MKKILVVDDSEIVRSITIELLDKKGYTTFSAVDGVNGLEVARQALPDLILCDLIMPELDGYGLLAELRADPSTAGIPFVFLTGDSSPQTHQPTNSPIANAYLSKPFTYGELCSVVKTFLPA